MLVTVLFFPPPFLIGSGETSSSPSLLNRVDGNTECFVIVTFVIPPSRPRLSVPFRLGCRPGSPFFVGSVSGCNKPSKTFFPDVIYGCRGQTMGMSFSGGVHCVFLFEFE